MLSENGKIVKRELEAFNQSKRKLRNLQEELRTWRELDGVRSAGLEERTTGGISTPFAEKRVIKIEELEKMISDAIDEAIESENKFLQDITSLDALSQNLLMERYMTGKSLKRIMREFNYSERNVYYLYDKAFEKIAKSKYESK